MNANRLDQLKTLKPKRAAFLVILLFDIVVAAFIAQQIVTYRDYPFGSDEAAHANGGLELALDLRAGDIGAFLNHTYHQDFYPPAYSWLEAAAFLLFGASTVVARLCSLACLFLGVLVIYAIGLELDDRLGWLIGSLAAVLTLTSEALMSISARTMLEAPGLLVSFGMLWAYLRVIKEPTKRRLIIASLLLVVTVLTKYPYGVVLVPTIVLAECITLAQQLRGVQFEVGKLKETVLRWTWLFGPFLVSMAVWFVGPNKVANFINYAQAQPQQDIFWSVDHLIFYPRSIAFYYDPSPLFAALSLAGFVWAIQHVHRQDIRVLLGYLTMGMLIMTLKLQTNPRFIATVAPALHILTAAMLVQWVDQWRRGREAARVTRILIAAVMVVCVVGSIPFLIDRFLGFPALVQIKYKTNPSANDLSAWIAAQTNGQANLLMINPWDEYGPAALTWYFATHNSTSNLRLSDVSVPAWLLSGAAGDNVDALHNYLQSGGVKFVVVLTGGPQGSKQAWADYLSSSGDNLAEISRKKFQIDWYNMTFWLKKNLITRCNFETAQTNLHHPLNVVAIVYRVADLTP